MCFYIYIFFQLGTDIFISIQSYVHFRISLIRMTCIILFLCYEDIKNEKIKASKNLSFFHFHIQNISQNR